MEPARGITIPDHVISLRRMKAENLRRAWSSQKCEFCDGQPSCFLYYNRLQQSPDLEKTMKRRSYLLLCDEHAKEISRQTNRLIEG
jgi:hypothetical protein